MSEVQYLLDTDSVSYFLRGDHPQLSQRLCFAPTNSLAVSVITQAELLAGLRALPPADSLQIATRSLLKSIVGLPWTSAAAEAYADIRASLSRSGLSIGAPDMLIAAHAISRDVTLVTSNTRHLSRIDPSLKLANWAA